MHAIVSDKYSGFLEIFREDCRQNNINHSAYIR